MCPASQFTPPHLDNQHNMGIKSTNSTGCVGVSKRTDTGSYHAYIDNDNQRIHLGNFSSLKDAVKSRKDAEFKYGFHNNHGVKKAWEK